MIIEMPEFRWLVFIGEQSMAGIPTGILKAVSAFALFLVVAYAEARHRAFPAPLHEVRQSHYANLGVILVNEGVLSLVPVSAPWGLADSYSEAGLLRPVSNRATRWALSLVLLDCMLYPWHGAIHGHDFLGALNRIHHSDRCMNASTSFRMHAIELLRNALIRVLLMFLVGVDSSVMILNEGIATAFVLLHHANVRLPDERGVLGALFVVPSQQRVQPSCSRSEHDRNCGAIFSLWDRWFGSLASGERAPLGLANEPGLTLACILWDGVPVGFGLAVGAWYVRAVACGSNGRRGRWIWFRLRSVRRVAFFRLTAWRRLLHRGQSKNG